METINFSAFCDDGYSKYKTIKAKIIGENFKIKYKIGTVLQVYLVKISYRGDIYYSDLSLSHYYIREDDIQLMGREDKLKRILK